jgi:quercetin dioxygenase-like cupin family protein
MTMSYVRAGEGPSAWVVGDTYTFKATAEQTGGAFALIEASIPPGSGPPPHTHTREDEAFYLLDGALEITAGEQTTLARPGDFVYLPRGLVHCFRNPTVGAARALILVTPAGFERFFQEVGMPARPGE